MSARLFYGALAVLVGILGLLVFQSFRGQEPIQSASSRPQPAANTGTGSLSGDVFVLMKSGDVKRGADVEVHLVADVVTGPWAQAVERFKREDEEARAALKREQASWDAQRAADMEQLRADLRAGRRPKSTEDMMQGYGSVNSAASRVDQIRDRADGDLRGVIANHTVKTSRTDINGHFEFATIPVGRYYLVSFHQVFDNRLFWMVPTEIRSGAHKPDLSSSNSGQWPF